ncbi:hypothetical protein ACIFOC_02906 [Leucobacter aridicollis]|uniref:CPBP family intramembrane glutamic endopeptidase n=1 Tax=Leucobacter aridicollis TaxID=283878 RepID=UPI0037CA0E1F
MTQPPPIDGHTPGTGGAEPQGGPTPNPAPVHPDVPVQHPQYAPYPEQTAHPAPVPPQGQTPYPQQQGAPAVAPQWAWAQQQPQFVEVETEPLEYHRLYRGAPRYAWWKPLVVLVLAASIYFAMNIAYSLALMPVLLAFDPDYVNDALFMQIAPILDTQHPLSILLNLGTVALMIPAVLLAMLALGIRPVGRVWSVAGRIRWGLLWRTTAAAVLAVIVMNGVGILFGMAMESVAASPATEPLAAEAPEFNGTAALISFILVLLLVPFQAAAEEVVFRGLFLQVLGSWMRSPWLAIGLSTFAFAAMHIYDIWGLVAVGLMGLTAAWLTWKTGGLEAAIAIHVINNIAAFGFMAAGLSGSTGQVESSGGIESVVGEIAGLALFAWLVVRIFTKHGYGRERIDRVWRAASLASGGAGAA